VANDYGFGRIQDIACRVFHSVGVTFGCTLGIGEPDVFELKGARGGFKKVGMGNLDTVSNRDASGCIAHGGVPVVLVFIPSPLSINSMVTD
jgi:hypothetical protein